MQARSAYGFDPDHAFNMVSDMLKHRDAKLDTKLAYNYLENALFQGLMGYSRTPSLLDDVRVRMMQRDKPLVP